MLTLIFAHLYMHFIENNNFWLVLEIVVFVATIAVFNGSICTLHLEDFFIYFASGFETWFSRTDMEPAHSMSTRWMAGYKNEGGSVFYKSCSLRHKVYSVFLRRAT